MRAEEPATLLFQTLPKACDCDHFEADAPPSHQKVKRFVAKLRESIDELRAAYPQLLQKMKDEIQNGFQRSGSFGEVRKELAQAASRVLTMVKEPRIKAFCLRLADQGLDDDPWMEAMGSFLCSKPPSKWIDNDISQFEDEFYRCVRQYFRVQSTLFNMAGNDLSVNAMRVAITIPDGSEIEQVVDLDASEEKSAAELEVSIARLIAGAGMVGIVAATRALRTELMMGNRRKS
jgi:hypothetical protein